jgi:hypothetical protein
VLRYDGNILRAFTEWGQRQSQNIQAVEKVRQKAAVINESPYITVGRSH